MAQVARSSTSDDDSRYKHAAILITITTYRVQSAPCFCFKVEKTSVQSEPAVWRTFICNRIYTEHPVWMVYRVPVITKRNIERSLQYGKQCRSGQLSRPATPHPGQAPSDTCSLPARIGKQMLATDHEDGWIWHANGCRPCRCMQDMGAYRCQDEAGGFGCAVDGLP